MTANIIGPGQSGDQSVSIRPEQVVTGVGVWQWFADCTSEAAKDGTRLRADFLNKLIAQLRYAIQGMGVTEAENDDTMLLQCFQKLQFTNWLNLPIYPEILQSGGVLAVTDLGGGSLMVAAGQSFLHRGWNKIETNDYSDANRTVVTVASKTYHLRWQYNAGSPIFVLKDTADGVYNPGALSEDNAAFDSTYDDMLIAKIVTDGSNVATVTSLMNLADLNDRIYSTGNCVSSGANISYRSPTLTYNWARQPSNLSVEIQNIDTGVGGAANWPYNVSADHDMAMRITSRSRYATALYLLRDYSHVITINLDIRA